MNLEELKKEFDEKLEKISAEDLMEFFEERGCVFVNTKKATTLEKLKDIEYLEQHLEDLKESVEPELDKVFRDWYKVTKGFDEKGRRYDCDDGQASPSGNKWKVDYGSILVEWESHWAYGGHDRGSYSMPLSLFEDPEALKKLAERETQRIAEKKKANEKRVVENELRLLKELKEKHES